MTALTLNNFAFIDSQNINLGVNSLGWKLDWKRFRIHLKESYGVSTAYVFIGFLPENQGLYQSLQRFGYVLIFKPVTYRGDGKAKGNVDAELVLQAMIDFDKRPMYLIPLYTPGSDYQAWLITLERSWNCVTGSPRRPRAASTFNGCDGLTGCAVRIVRA
jgi:NYN domain